MHKMSGAGKCLDFSDFFPLEIKPKMREILVKMRERRKNAGFPARLRDG